MVNSTKGGNKFRQLQIAGIFALPVPEHGHR
jgi:hypothetical protein